MTICKITTYNLIKLIKQPVIVTMLFILLLVGLRPAASQAQEGSQQPVLFINQVDSSAFPKVTINVSASGADGYPLVGLRGSDFLIFENEAEIEAGKITARPESATEMRLIIGFDLSTPPAALENMKKAAIGLIETLGPRDRVALLTFHNQVDQLYPFTNNLNELRWAINTLLPQGSNTELNAAFAEAITMFDSEPTGRKAAIMLTDRLDPGTSMPNEALIIRAQDAAVPLYPIGFGSGVQADALAQLGRLTGGLGVALAGSGDLPTFFQTLSVILPQSYAITYQSELQANDQSQDLSVNVVKQQVVSRPAFSELVTQSSLVGVALTGVSEGDTVQGTVTLNAQIIAARVPIASVEYFKDDQSLAVITAPPYSYVWDTRGLTPGAATVSVTVVDEAGNRGTTDAVVNVIPAELEVTATTNATEITAGDPVDIQVQVEPLADTARVDLWFDGVIIASDNTPPYAFEVDTSRYEAGTHEFIVQALGTADQSGQTDFNVLFLAVPPLTRFGKQIGYRNDLNNDWFDLLVRALIIFTGIGLIITIVFVTINLIRRIVQRLTHVQPQQQKLKIYNTGNVRSRFEIRAEEPTGFLTFQFSSSNGLLLQQPPPVEMIDQMPPAYASAGTGAVAAGSGRPGSQQATVISPSVARAVPAGSAPAAAKQPAAKAGAPSLNPVALASKAKGAAKATQGIADLLGTVGALLPGGAGSAVRNMAQQMRDASTKASMAASQPEQMMRTAQSAQSKVGKMAPQMPKGMALPTPAGAAAGAAAAPRSPAGTAPPTAMPAMAAATPARASTPVQVATPAGSNAHTRAKMATQPLKAAPQTFRDWVQTPPVEPGQSVTLICTVIPARNNETRDCAVKLTSTPVEQPNIAPTVDQETIHIKQLSLFRRVLLPVLISLLMMMIAILFIGVIAYFTITADSIAQPFTWG